MFMLQKNPDEDETVYEEDMIIDSAMNENAFESIAHDEDFGNNFHLIVVAKKDKQIDKMERFLGKRQQVKQGGFLPKLNSDIEKETYTLVLDLDETLIHFQTLSEIQQHSV